MLAISGQKIPYIVARTLGNIYTASLYIPTGILRETHTKVEVVFCS